MTVVSSDYLQSVLTNFRALFQNDFDAASAGPGWQQLVMNMDSDGEINTYEWFGTVPKMTKLNKGTTPIDSLTEYNFSITNEEYQAAIEVARTALERDKLGLIAPRISQLALEAARHPSELVFSLFETNPTTFDGTAFFADAHSVATFDNLLAGTGVTVAAFQTDLGTAKATMRLFKDDKGRPMNLVPNIIVVPAQLETVAWISLNANQSGQLVQTVPPANTTGSWSAGGYNVIVNPFLTDANDWYLFADGGPTRKPFIVQTEKAPVLESDTNPDSRENIINRNFLYSVYGRYNVGMTDPRLGVKTTN